MVDIDLASNVDDLIEEFKKISHHSLLRIGRSLGVKCSHGYYDALYEYFSKFRCYTINDSEGEMHFVFYGRCCRVIVDGKVLEFDIYPKINNISHIWVDIYRFQRYLDSVNILLNKKAVIDFLEMVADAGMIYRCGEILNYYLLLPTSSGFAQTISCLGVKGANIFCNMKYFVEEYRNIASQSLIRIGRNYGVECSEGHYEEVINITRKSRSGTIVDENGTLKYRFHGGRQCEIILDNKVIDFNICRLNGVMYIGIIFYSFYKHIFNINEYFVHDYYVKENNDLFKCMIEMACEIDIINKNIVTEITEEYYCPLSTNQLSQNMLLIDELKIKYILSFVIMD